MDEVDKTDKKISRSDKGEVIVVDQRPCVPRDSKKRKGNGDAKKLGERVKEEMVVNPCGNNARKDKEKGQPFGYFELLHKSKSNRFFPIFHSTRTSIFILTEGPTQARRLGYLAQFDFPSPFG